MKLSLTNSVEYFPTSHFQPEVNETYGIVFVFVGGYLTVTSVVLLNQKKN